MPATLPETRPDDDILQFMRWRGGDTREGDALARRYGEVLQKFFRTRVRPEDIEDVMQQVWVGLGSSLSKTTTVEIRTTLRSYIFGVARHTLFRYLRSRYRLGDTDPIDTSMAILDPSLSQVVGERLQIERMLQTLQGLPVDMHILLELRYLNQMSTAELAAVYEVPKGTIKSRLANARQKLEQAMQQRGTLG